MKQPFIDRTLLLHIGLPKCASTSIQRMLYKRHLPHYLGKPPHRVYLEKSPPKLPGNITDLFVQPLISEFFRWQIPYVQSHLFDVDFWGQQLKDYLDRHVGPSETVIVSEELLSGASFDNYKLNYRPDPLMILERLRSVFSRVEVLVICRAVEPFLRSYYNQLVKYGFNLSYEHFINLTMLGKQGSSIIFELRDYLAMARQRGLNLTVIPLETLATEKGHQKMEAFFQVPLNPIRHVNKSASQFEVLEKLRENMQDPVGYGRKTLLDDVCISQGHLRQQIKQENHPGPYALSSSTLKQLREASQKAHQRLAAEIDWDLSSLGYVV